LKRDVLSILEAAYTEFDDPDAWLGHALEAVQPNLDRGTGVMAHFFAHRPDGLWAGRVQAHGPDAAIVPALHDLLRADLEYRKTKGAKTAFWRKAYPSSPTVGWLNQLLGHSWTVDVAPHLEMLRPEQRAVLTAMNDALGVVAGDPSGEGCIFFTRDMRAMRLPAQTAALWQRIAAHLVTGYRLVRQKVRAPDAILDPFGKMLHREDSVGRGDTEALRDATRAIDRARGTLRRADPDAAIALWKALVAGRWSLVDHFDHDGRRFVFARRNTIETHGWPTLTEREAQVVAYIAEGQSFKLIAYQLGVCPATVSADVARAQKKLAVRSRIELVAAYRRHLSEERRE
jgi:DNA-binding CsgD family transcriptional regulator